LCNRINIPDRSSTSSYWLCMDPRDVAWSHSSNSPRQRNPGYNPLQFLPDRLAHLFSPTSSRWLQQIDLNVASTAGIKYESPMRTGTHRRMSIAGDSVRWKHHSTPCSRRYTDPKMLDSVIIVKVGMGRREPCSEHRISCFLRRGLSMGFPK
jgi:hypothetical protein